MKEMAVGFTRAVSLILDFIQLLRKSEEPIKFWSCSVPVVVD